MDKDICIYCGIVFSYMSTCQHASHASHGDANVYSAVIVKTARKTNLYSIFFDLQKKDTLDYRRVVVFFLLYWSGFQVLKHLALPHIAQSGRIGLVSVASDPPMPKSEEAKCATCLFCILLCTRH